MSVKQLLLSVVVVVVAVAAAGALALALIPELSREAATKGGTIAAASMIGIRIALWARTRNKA
jgi:hypothetical protein